MSLLQQSEPENATGKVAEIYASMINGMGFVPNAFKVFSPSPHLLEQQNSNLTYFMRHKSLSGKLLALIRLLVSDKEECRYCVTMNSGILMQYGLLPEAQAEIKDDPSKAPLDAKELALLLFVLKVTRDSNSVQASDLEQLRALGLTDGDILDATYHGCIQVGVDKIFNAFQVSID